MSDRTKNRKNEPKQMGDVWTTFGSCRALSVPGKQKCAWVESQQAHTKYMGTTTATLVERSTARAAVAARALPGSVAAAATYPPPCTSGNGNGSCHAELVDGADVKVFPGEVLAVIGDNGAGKSGLLKTLTGALEPDAGEILPMGRTSSRSPTVSTYSCSAAASPSCGRRTTPWPRWWRS